MIMFAIAIIFLALVVFICQRKNSNNESPLNSACKKVNSSNNKHFAPKNGSVNKSLAKTAADEACNPLVPKHTAAPFQNVSNQPPPLPPKLSRHAQLYQNLGSNAHTNNINGLPTVEVCFKIFILKISVFNIF